MGNIVSDIGRFVNHSHALRGMDKLARRLGIVRFLHIMQSRSGRSAAKEDENFRRFCGEHREELQRIYGLLEDDFSRDTLERVLKYRLTGDTDLLMDIVKEPQYFQRDILASVKDEVFVDGGAYVGDTVENFIRYWGGTRKYMLGNLMEPILQH